MNYLSQSLTFESDKIYYTEEGIEFEVMMDWEAPLMSASAAYVCQNGGDILEIGFGMGISADYIQSHSITSHTIIENHPAIIPKAKAWASGKSNVTIITGSWYDVKDNLPTYNGLFYDTWGDDDMQYFSSSLSSLVKEGGVVTWWNNLEEKNNFYNIPNVDYQQYSVNPPTNNYFNNTIYYLPKCQQ
jgi:type IV protein arginine methyltransferase|tara:strand:- start:1130 stop:1690 length:561 start_codon:yes stop_codon:yes gene_type:complete